MFANYVIQQQRTVLQWCVNVCRCLLNHLSGLTIRQKILLLGPESELPFSKNMKSCNAINTTSEI